MPQRKTHTPVSQLAASPCLQGKKETKPEMFNMLHFLSSVALGSGLLFGMKIEKCEIGKYF